MKVRYSKGAEKGRVEPSGEKAGKGTLGAVDTMTDLGGKGNQKKKWIKNFGKKKNPDMGNEKDQGLKNLPRRMERGA